MEGMTTFTSDKEPLNDILNEIYDGKVQLPEFQRGWIWDNDHICSLLASVSLAYPIGAVMVLENGNPEVRFKPRPVEGVKLQELLQPERFILDGQQRLTSLYQALFLDEAVTTRDIRGKAIKRWYYIKMAPALDPNIDREEAIIGLPEDKKVKNFRNEVLEDYSYPEAEYEHDLFPVSKLFNSAGWRREYNKYWKHDEEKSNLFDNFEERVIETFKQYLVPIIKLLKKTPKEAVCQVFEKVNTGGVSLNVFELLTATFAADEFDLREDWEGKRDAKGKKIADGRHDILKRQNALRSVSATDFLQAITLLATFSRKKDNPEAPVSCKRAEVLKLKLEYYKAWADPVTEGFKKVSKFLFQQKIFSDRDLPYGTQLVPLSALFTVLGDKADNDAVRAKLIYWYWCGVFGELFGSAVETRFAKDVIEVLDWIEGGDEPSTIIDCNFAPIRLYTLKSRRSAAYKGLFALLIRDTGLDFRTGEPIDVQMYFDDKIDIHHIFPRDYCKKVGIEAKYYDSIINKTPLSARTNKIIGGKAPSVYLQSLVQQTGIKEDRIDQILTSHVIDMDAIKSDDFQTFFSKRREALLQRIENATGKKILRETDQEIVKTLKEEEDLWIEEEEDTL